MTLYRVSQFAYYDIRQSRPCNIYKIDRAPTAGILATHVKSVEPAKSRLTQYTGCNCIYALTAENGDFVTYASLPEFLSWIIDNGYTVLPSMTAALLPEKSFYISG